MKKVCNGCKNDFEATKGTKYCPSCRMVGVPLTCGTCGKPAIKEQTKHAAQVSAGSKWSGTCPECIKPEWAAVINEVGNKYETYEILHIHRVDNRGNAYWWGQCTVCGRIESLKAADLRGGRVAECIHQDREVGTIHGDLYIDSVYGYTYDDTLYNVYCLNIDCLSKLVMTGRELRLLRSDYKCTHNPADPMLKTDLCRDTFKYLGNLLTCSGTRFTTEEITDVALVALYAAPGMRMAELRGTLQRVCNLTPADLVSLKSRNTTRFHNRVNNLTSHRLSSNSVYGRSVEYRLTPGERTCRIYLNEDGYARVRSICAEELRNSPSMFVKCKEVLGMGLNFSGGVQGEDEADYSFDFEFDSH